MLKRILNTDITLIAWNALTYAPLLRAIQLSLPSCDLIAPVITQDKYEKTVSPDNNHEVNIKVINNVDSKLVSMHYQTTSGSAACVVNT